MIIKKKYDIFWHQIDCTFPVKLISVAGFVFSIGISQKANHRENSVSVPLYGELFFHYLGCYLKYVIKPLSDLNFCQFPMYY